MQDETTIPDQPAVSERGCQEGAVPRLPSRKGSGTGDEGRPVCDVRWALELAAKGGYGISYTDQAVQEQIRMARVLVTELIEADREFDLAEADYRATHARLGLADHEPLDSMHPAAVRVQAARSRRSHALTRALGRES